MESSAHAWVNQLVIEIAIYSKKKKKKKENYYHSLLIKPRLTVSASLHHTEIGIFWPYLGDCWISSCWLDNWTRGSQVYTWNGSGTVLWLLGADSSKFYCYLSKIRFLWAGWDCGTVWCHFPPFCFRTGIFFNKGTVTLSVAAPFVFIWFYSAACMKIPFVML